MSGGGAKKVATFLLALDHATAAELLKALPELERRAVTEALADMSDTFLDREMQEALLRDFREGLKKSNGTTAPPDAIAGLLARALGQHGKTYADRIQLVKRLDTARARLEMLDGPSFAFLLAKEHPQVIAVVLLALGPTKASEALPHFTVELQQDLVQRMVFMEPTTDLMQVTVLEGVVDRAHSLDEKHAASGDDERLKNVARMLNKFNDEARKTMMANLEAVDPQRAQRVRDQMFTFDDLQKLGPRDVQRILAGIDGKVLALALKGATPESASCVLANLSKRAQERVAEEKDTLGAVRLSEVRKAQSEIAAVALDLIQRGEIKFAGETEDALVQ